MRRWWLTWPLLLLSAAQAAEGQEPAAEEQARQQAISLLLEHHYDPEEAEAFALAPDFADGLPSFVERQSRLDAETLAKARANAAALGLTIFAVEGRPMVVPYVGGAAWRAGMAQPAPLNQISGFDATSIGAAAQLLAQLDRTSDQAVAVTIGQLGEERRLRLPWGEGAPRPVDAFQPQPGLLVIRLYAFEPGRTQQAVAESLDHFHPDQVVLDLRYLSGGAVGSAAATAGLFLGPDRPFAVLSKPYEEISGFATPPGGRPAFDGPVTLLIGPWTYSAGEVFALALQREGGVASIGEWTYGKCVMQADFPLVDGSSLKIPVARLDVDGVRCQGAGVSPAVEVPLEVQNNDAWLLTAGLELARLPHYACREGEAAAGGAVPPEMEALARSLLTNLVQLRDGDGRQRLCLGPYATADGAETVAKQLNQAGGAYSVLEAALPGTPPPD